MNIRERILELALDGVPYTKISKQIGMPAQKIGAIARENGIRRKDPEISGEIPSLGDSKNSIEWRERFIAEWTAATERILRYGTKSN